MNKKGFIILLMCLFIGSASFAQGRKGLKINEVMVQNDSNYVDDYGKCHAWIELYNSTYSIMEISSMYITNDKNALIEGEQGRAARMKYSIPRGDVLTEIHPRQHILFWADNEPEKGTFHINFNLKSNEDNWIGVYDANGETLIDSITVPASLMGNQTYARISDGIQGATTAETWEVRDGSKVKYITPSSNNEIIDMNKKIRSFRENDSTGVGMAVMAMGVVFFSLLVLCVAFKMVGKMNEAVAKRNKIKAHQFTDEAVTAESRKATTEDVGEEIAAVCMAMYEHLNAHDNEDTVLTMNKVKRAYSPWSSKIYTLREIPRR